MMMRGMRRRIGKVQVHAEAANRIGEGQPHAVERRFRRDGEDDPHEEAVRSPVPELRAFRDVAAKAGQHARDGRHDPRLIVAGKRQDEALVGRSGLWSNPPPDDRVGRF